MSLLPPVLYTAPLLEPQTGLVSRPWQQWLQALETRVGGSVAPTITEIHTTQQTLVTAVSQLTTVQQTLVTQVTAVTQVQQTLVTQLTEVTAVQQTLVTQIAQLAQSAATLQAILVELRRARLGVSLLTDTDLAQETLDDD
jgi:hypothetical protein